MLVFGVHPVREAIRSSAYRPLTVFAWEEKRGERGQIDWIVRQAGTGIVRWVPRRELDRLAAGGNHQGIAAEVPEFAYAAPEPPPRTGRPRRVALLDGITDPQNLGNLCRSAVALGIDLLVLPEDRSARPNATVARVSAGAMFHARIALAPSLAHVAEALKEDGFLVLGLDAASPEEIRAVNAAGDIALILGAEDRGLRRSVRARCDRLVRVATDPRFPQLNAATALAVALFALAPAARQ